MTGLLSQIYFCFYIVKVMNKSKKIDKVVDNSKIKNWILDCSKNAIFETSDRKILSFFLPKLPKNRLH